MFSNPPNLWYFVLAAVADKYAHSQFLRIHQFLCSLTLFYFYPSPLLVLVSGSMQIYQTSPS